MSDRREVSEEEFDAMRTVLMVKKQNDGPGVVVALDNEAFESPGAWGIVIADLVQHVANAYAQDGYAARMVMDEIRRVVLSELAAPTAKAEPCGWEMT